MKKIINGFLVGIGATIGVMLVLAALALAANKEEVVGIDRSIAIQRVNSGEDCWISADGKEFYIAEGRDENGMPTTVHGYKIVN